MNNTETVAKKGKAPWRINFNSEKVCGTSNAATSRDTENANTASLRASMRKISDPRFLKWRTPELVVFFMPGVANYAGS
jgi:hypothetical protein